MFRKVSRSLEKFKILLLCLLTSFTLSAFATTKIQPQNLTPKTRCAACRMIVLQYYGPHAQVVWKHNGKLVRKFYGNLSEVMPTILRKPHFVAAVYVQPLGHYLFTKMHIQGDWIPAKKAFYVVDSHQKFIMGESYTPFETQKKARAFQKKHGGKIINYVQLENHLLAKK